MMCHAMPLSNWDVLVTIVLCPAYPMSTYSVHILFCITNNLMKIWLMEIGFYNGTVFDSINLHASNMILRLLIWIFIFTLTRSNGRSAILIGSLLFICDVIECYVVFHGYLFWGRRSKYRRQISLTSTAEYAPFHQLNQ